MSAKHPAPEDDGLRYQLSDSADTFRADSSAFGMGSIQDFQYYLVLPLQSRFQKKMHRDDDSRDDITKAGQLVLHHTLHGQLLLHLLTLASAIGFGVVQSRRIANTLRAYYKKYFPRLSGRPMDGG